MPFKRNKNVSKSTPARELSFDDHLNRVVDSYSRIGEQKYISTHTYRGPIKLNLIQDGASPHQTIYLSSNNSIMNMYVIGAEVSGDKPKNGLRHYRISPDEQGNPSVEVGEFVPYSELVNASLEINEGCVVKQFSGDNGSVGSDNPDIAWLQESGMLNEAQTAEMDMVGFALQAVSPHLVAGSSFHPVV
jgi:hypothetical protein